MMADRQEQDRMNDGRYESAGYGRNGGRTDGGHTDGALDGERPDVTPDREMPRDGRSADGSPEPGSREADPDARFRRPMSAGDLPPHDRYDVRAGIPDSPRRRLAPEELERESEEEKPQNLMAEIIDWVKYILVAIVLGLLITNFVAQRNEVVGESMLPTLQNEDQLIVEKISKHITGLEPGDVVTISGAKLDPPRPHEDLVKRIVAMAGQHVEIRDDMTIYIDGELLEEPYLAPGTVTAPRLYGAYNDVIVPEGHVYVLGDNRAHSADSREFGPVPVEAIHGKVWVRIYPFDRFGLVD